MRLTEKDRDMCHMRRRIHATDRDRRRRTETDREAVTVQAPPPPQLLETDSIPPQSVLKAPRRHLFYGYEL